MFFNNQNKKTELAATDSYRLATNTVSEIPINNIGILSFRALNETIKLFENTNEPIKINSNEKELHLYNEKFSASLRKLEGTFPEYKNLFPKETLFSIEVKKTEILEICSQDFHVTFLVRHDSFLLVISSSISSVVSVSMNTNRTAVEL